MYKCIMETDVDTGTSDFPKNIVECMWSMFWFGKKRLLLL